MLLAVYELHTGPAEAKKMMRSWHCLVAMALVAWLDVACTTAPSCGYGIPTETCPRGATIAVSTPLARSSMAGATMVACRNGECATLALSPSGAATCDVVAPNANLSVRCQLPSVVIGCGFEMSVLIDAPHDTLRDGDTYSVRVFVPNDTRPVFEWSHSVSYSHVTDVCRTQCTYADTTHLAPSSSSAGCGSADAGGDAAPDARKTEIVRSSEGASAP